MTDDDESVTVEVEVGDEMLAAMRRLRRSKRRDRGQTTAELSEESPAELLEGLIMDAISDDLRRSSSQKSGPIDFYRKYSD